MVDEYDFPKDNGDILYAGDTNKLWGVGNGVSGAYSDSGDLSMGSVYQYTTFTLTSGETLTVDNKGEPLIIFVQGDCSIDGTINLEGMGYSGGVGAINDAVGNAGKNFQRNSNWGKIAGGGPGAAVGGGGGASILNHGLVAPSTGGAGGSTFIKTNTYDIKYNSSYIDSGQGGGGGGAAPSSSGGDGGFGGGALIMLVGGSFTLDTNGLINCNGGTGNDAWGAGAGGGGGGGAGCIWVMYGGALTNSGSIAVVGGIAGSGIGAGSHGGIGGAGTYKIQKVNHTFPVVA